MNSGYPDYYESAAAQTPAKVSLAAFKSQAPKIKAAPANATRFQECMKKELEVTIDHLSCADKTDLLLQNLEKLGDVETVLKSDIQFSDYIFGAHTDGTPAAVVGDIHNLMAPQLLQREMLANPGNIATSYSSQINHETNMKIHMQDYLPQSVADNVVDATTGIADDIILEVLVFEGTCAAERTLFGVNYEVQKGFYRNQKRPALHAQSITILGSNTLAHLADEIMRHCKFSNEYLPSTQEHAIPTKIGEILTSNYFLIEEEFFVDYRKNRQDISLELRSWLETEDAATMKLGQRFQERIRNIESPKNPMNPEDSSRMRLDTLEIKLGFPYLFVHQGAIERLVVFSDVRMVTKYDCQSKSRYPYTLRYIPENLQRCCLCTKKVAKIETADDELADDTPAYWCAECFKMLHYDERGQPVAEFKWRMHLHSTIHLSNDSS